MKKNLKLKTSLLLLLILIVGCSKTETDVLDVPLVNAIILSTNQTSLVTGGNAEFTVISNLGTNLTSQTVFYVNDLQIASNSYTFLEDGTYSVKAVYQNLTSNIIQVIVDDQIVIPTKFVNRVLVEEYSGTWCGNCPRILYGIELLKQQTDNEVSVQIHLFGNDPFITSQGNTIASEQNVSSVPTGKINRTINWNSPQYQNVNQVIDEIKSSSAVGLAINSSVAAGNVNINITLGYASISAQTKLVVYIVEDNLFNAQANYSSSLYGGLSSIPNFKYDGVLRSVVSTTGGDAITVSGNQVQKNYSVALPANVSNVANAKIVAFLIDSSTNSVLNVRQSAIDQSQELEIIN